MFRIALLLAAVVVQVPRGTSEITLNETTLTVEYGRPSLQQWALVVNTETGQWGTQHDRSKDILGIPLKWEKQEESVEQLTIELTKETDETGILAISWGHELLRQRFRLSP